LLVISVIKSKKDIWFQKLLFNLWITLCFFKQLSVIAILLRTTGKTLSFTDKAYHYLQVYDNDWLVII